MLFCYRSALSHQSGYPLPVSLIALSLHLSCMFQIALLRPENQRNRASRAKMRHAGKSFQCSRYSRQGRWDRFTMTRLRAKDRESFARVTAVCQPPRIDGVTVTGGTTAEADCKQDCPAACPVRPKRDRFPVATGSRSRTGRITPAGSPVSLALAAILRSRFDRR